MCVSYTWHVITRVPSQVPLRVNNDLHDKYLHLKHEGTLVITRGMSHVCEVIVPYVQCKISSLLVIKADFPKITISFLCG